RSALLSVSGAGPRDCLHLNDRGSDPLDSPGLFVAARTDIVDHGLHLPRAFGDRTDHLGNLVQADSAFVRLRDGLLNQRGRVSGRLGGALCQVRTSSATTAKPM